MVSNNVRYNVCFMVMTYFLPMSLMTATYTAIGRELWGQQAIGEATEVQKESIKSKRRVIIFLKETCSRMWSCYYFRIPKTGENLHVTRDSKYE